ncbi:AraC family transcriptional regulator [Paenibacillus albidus]|uniref:AraC family transcriptional regulator n=1 Tax=Paenibacillus albidus TaxID=2041023 RepID=A0A917CC02_9BACL|nr:helix-turn-helix domain-containing protein [Paenibacillus albidus]GGF82420.1 AraC family transcriptional regulator [Paenibacillus albidus]
MYNVLLVDDEPGHLTGLSRMLKRIRPDYGIHTARNGREALEECSRYSFQIIISDIRMPVMDGLHFMEQLSPGATPRRVIYLSGYNHFDYAQKAMSLGSFEYVLKPLDVDKFMSVLEKTEKSLEQELDSLLAREQLAARLNAAEPAYNHRLLNDWIEQPPSGSADTAGLAEIAGLLGFRGDGGCLIVACLEGAAECPPAVQEILTARVRACGRAAGFHSRQDQRLFVIVSEVYPQEELLRQLNAPGVSVGISRWSPRLLATAPAAYTEARHAVMEGFYARPGESRVYLAERSRIDPQRRLTPALRLEALITEAVNGSGHGKGAAEASAALLSRMLAGGGLPLPVELARNIRQLAFKVVHDLELLQPEARRELLNRISTLHPGYGGLTELAASVEVFLVEITEALQEARRDRKDGLMARCLDYINQHYTEELSLESVAEAFHFNPSYFCHYFKSKLNITFSQYVTGLRLSKAKELLAASSDKVYTVAHQLGYRDVKYFNRVFKKEFGLTPEEYRSLARSKAESAE